MRKLGKNALCCLPAVGRALGGGGFSLAILRATEVAPTPCSLVEDE